MSIGHLLSCPHLNSKSSLCTLLCEAASLQSLLCCKLSGYWSDMETRARVWACFSSVSNGAWLQYMFLLHLPGTSQAKLCTFPDLCKTVPQKWLPLSLPQATRSKHPNFHPASFHPLLSRQLFFTVILLLGFLTFSIQLISKFPILNYLY